MVRDDDRQRVLTTLAGVVIRASRNRVGPAPIKYDRLEEWDEWDQELRTTISDIMDAIVENAIERLDKAE